MNRSTFILNFSLLFATTALYSQQTTSPNLLPTNGNVGIGTSSPQERLQVCGRVVIDSTVLVRDSMRVQQDLVVDGNARISGTVRAGSFGFTGPVVQLASDCYQLLAVSGQGLVQAFDEVAAEAILNTNPCPTTPTYSPYWQTFGNVVSNNNRFIGTLNNFDFAIKTNGVQRMRFLAGGGISINDSYVPAGYQLAVKGKIIAEEITVKLRSNWPDFVFDSTYTLMPLQDVELFVKRERHLPNIPSASQVAQTGIDAGEMSGALLQKVEELTLYLIDLQKQVNELRKENETLRKSND